MRNQSHTSRKLLNRKKNSKEFLLYKQKKSVNILKNWTRESPAGHSGLFQSQKTHTLLCTK
uniref:Uncharacterized protein n=1 Tax=uncultured marine virus TaxID=186617 RepID=A0A0F7L5B7_9VIRU|nr:hypothetical protein [uncultured marine virus]